MQSKQISENLLSFLQITHIRSAQHYNWANPIQFGMAIWQKQLHTLNVFKSEKIKVPLIHMFI